MGASSKAAAAGAQAYVPNPLAGTSIVRMYGGGTDRAHAVMLEKAPGEKSGGAVKSWWVEKKLGWKFSVGRHGSARL